jgi:hypothetical protein
MPLPDPRHQLDDCRKRYAQNEAVATVAERERAVFQNGLVVKRTTGQQGREVMFSKEDTCESRGHAHQREAMDREPMPVVATLH